MSKKAFSPVGKVFLALLAVLFASSGTRADVPLRCYDPARVGCDFYAECLESKFYCGPEGYAINYATKYCNLFTQLDELSPKGMRWRDAALRCLQQQLYPLLDANWKVSCEGVKNFAHRTHPTCYTLPGNSLCDLPSSDLKIIAGVFKSATFSEVTADSFVQVAAILRNCISN